MKVGIVSDMHLGAHNCRFNKNSGSTSEPFEYNEELLAELVECFQSCDALVFNGDIVDVLIGSSRSFYKTDEARAEELERCRNSINRYLRPILDRCPNTRFIYQDGNHETGDLRQAEFLGQAFKELENDYPNFRWMPGPAMKVANFIITHSHDFIKREECNNRDKMCEILYNKLSAKYDLSQIEGIVFGHSHRVVMGREYAGKKFYNPGTFQKRDPGVMLTLEIEGTPEEGRVTDVTQHLLKNDLQVDFLTP